MDDYAIYTGNCCSGCSGTNNGYSPYSYPVKRPKLICPAAPKAKAKRGEKKGANGNKIVPLATKSYATSRKKQGIVKVSGCSKVKNVYSCSKPTKTKTKISAAAVVKEEAKGKKVGVVATYTSSTSKVVVSVEKEESVKVVVAGFLGF